MNILGMHEVCHTLKHTGINESCHANGQIQKHMKPKKMIQITYAPTPQKGLEYPQNGVGKS